MEWDFFISHASEDKAAVALPLAEELRRAGFRVWLDVLELKIGDNLHAKIDQGLARSAFGIVVLSNTFFEKRWAVTELGALFALEEPGKVRILPIWHGVNETFVARHSPFLASRIAISTDTGIFYIAQRMSPPASEGTISTGITGAQGTTPRSNPDRVPL